MGDNNYNKRISAFEPMTLLIGTIFSVLSAIICMQILGKVGISANTSIIGAVFAMALSRLPIKSFSKFRSLERQNYIQTIVSGSGFAASNCALSAVAIIFVLGDDSFILPMLFGSCIGIVVSIFVIGMLFDSNLFPAEGSWPQGVATAEALEAGDKGGEKAKRLLQGIVVGAIGSAFHLPAAGVGIVFIANIISMLALGIGLLLRGYSHLIISGFDLGQTYIPHGFMIGAGLVALIQSIIIVLRGKKSTNAVNSTTSKTETNKNIKVTILLYLLSTIIIALTSGLYNEMSVGMLILWIIWATFSAFTSVIIVGMASMHSGWFPAFAITTIFMMIGVLLGFPTIPLAILTGYVSSTGPCFADMGYDLKTGWIIRGEGTDVIKEAYGKKQQVLIEVLGSVIGVIVVWLTMNMYFEQDLIPPVSKVFATTITAGVNPGLVKVLLIWAIPGAIVQALGGASNMLGVLFATGLLINNPIYGIGVIFACVLRLIIGDSFMEIRDAGLIAGDGIYGFISVLIKSII